MRRVVTGFALALSICAAPLHPGKADGVLRVVPHSDLKVLDPLWAPAYITRNHGYMIYDTLFAADESGEIKPQMVESYAVSADGLTYTFTLRDGLLWHDGLPVTAEDCVASIERWAAKDASGQVLMGFVQGLEAVDSRTFVLRLKEPTGLVLPALGKRSAFVPFMMPKRVAETDPRTQIKDFTGSGPFVFRKEEWKPGHVVAYTRFDRYKPRLEPASGLAGGKIAKVDRVEWYAIKDHSQAINALLAGEIDYIEQPPHDLLPLLKADPNVKLWVWNPDGNQYVFRPNHRAKPFDNPKVRQALWLAFNQEDFLRAEIGDPRFYKVCGAVFVCGTSLASEEGMAGLLSSNFDKARELLEEAGYDGTPIVLLQPTDVASIANLAPVAKHLMEKAGFNVDMQAMDWQTLVMRRTRMDPPSAGGWHAFLSSNASVDMANPVVAQWVNSSCDKALPGWPCDPVMESLRIRYARASDPAEQKAIAQAVQLRTIEWTPFVLLGQWYPAAAARASLSGILPAGVPVFWNIEKR